MTQTVDYAHTRKAEQNRMRKAQALVEAATALGLVAVELEQQHPKHVERRKHVLAEADVRSASDETWAVVVEVYTDQLRALPGVTACTSCRSPVRWVLTDVKQQRMPLDPLPCPTGNVLSVATEHGPRARVLAGHDEHPDDVPLYRAHWASCPTADAHRRSKPVPCAECGRRMHPGLVALGAITHPTCSDRPGPDERTTL